MLSPTLSVQKSGRERTERNDSECVSVVLNVSSDSLHIAVLQLSSTKEHTQQILLLALLQ